MIDPGHLFCHNAPMLALMKSWSRIPKDLTILLSLTVLIHTPFLLKNAWHPSGDTLFCQEIFYAFYNHFFFHWELPRWLPFSSYGIQSDYWQLISITPAGYLAGLGGALLRTPEVFFIYKSSILLELLLLLLGSYALARTLFPSRAAAFWICLGLIGTSLWQVQASWNFHIYYLLPFVFYFLIRFLKEKRVHLGWLAGICFIMAQIGVPAYFVTLHFLILILFFVPLLAASPSCLLSFREKSRTHFLTLALFLLCAAVYFLFAFHMFDHVRSLAETGGRDAVTHTVPLQHFLTYSGSETNFIGFDKWLGLLFPDFKFMVCQAYAGFLTLPFILYALVRVRNRFFYAFLGTAFFLVLFSAGPLTPIAQWTYELYPPIRLFRYIGNLSSLARLFWLILAGFGLSEWLTDRARYETKKLSWNPAVFLTLLSGITLVIALSLIFQKPVLARYRSDLSGFFPFITGTLGFTAFFLLSGFLLTLLLQKKSWAKHSGLILCAFFAIEILSYQTGFWIKKFGTWPAAPPELTNVSGFSFPVTRSHDESESPRAKLFFEKVKGGLDLEAYHFVLFDKCLPSQLMTFHWNEIIYPLKDSLQLNLRLSRERAKDIVGCETPKIRLFPKGLDPESLVLPALDPLSLGTLKVRSFSFNHLTLETEVLAAKGVWLYYADAYHPSWQAWVDGRKENITVANQAFKAVPLTPGRHQVKWIYWDGWQSIRGILIALLGILFSAALLFIYSQPSEETPKLPNPTDPANPHKLERLQ